MSHSLDPSELKKRLAGDAPPFLVDVRRRADYEANPRVIPGAFWRDPEKIEDWIRELPAGAPVVVYCAKGESVSQSTAASLQKEGKDTCF